MGASIDVLIVSVGISRTISITISISASIFIFIVSIIYIDVFSNVFSIISLDPISHITRSIYLSNTDVPDSSKLLSESLLSCFTPPISINKPVSLALHSDGIVSVLVYLVVALEDGACAIVLVAIINTGYH